MAKKMHTQLLVGFLLTSTSVWGFRINDICSKEYNLDFQVIGYKCLFAGSGVYTVDGPPVDFVKFDLLNLQSYIYVNAVVRVVIIDNGLREYCQNILLGSGTVEKIIVGGQVCDLPSSPSTNQAASVSHPSTQIVTVKTEQAQHDPKPSTNQAASVSHPSTQIVTTEQAQHDPKGNEHAEERAGWIVGILLSIMGTIGFVIWHVVQRYRKRRARKRTMFRQRAFSERRRSATSMEMSSV